MAGFNKNGMNFSQEEIVVVKVQELQKMLNDLGYELDFDQVFKIYAFCEIKGYLEDIVPVD